MTEESTVGQGPRVADESGTDDDDPVLQFEGAVGTDGPQVDGGESDVPFK